MDLQLLVLVILGLMLIYMAIRDALTFRAGYRARNEARRTTAALLDLARVIRERNQEALQVERGKQLSQVDLSECSIEHSLNRLSNILSLAMAQPITLESVIQVTDQPFPAILLGGRETQYAVTINAQGFLETQARARMIRGKKGPTKAERQRWEAVHPVEITYSARQLVVDEELRQIFLAVGKQLGFANISLPPVDTWYALVLPGTN